MALEGKIDDAVFKALAILPMTGMPPSGRGPFPLDAKELIRLTFPFDVDELKRLIKEEPKLKPPQPHNGST